MGQGQALSQVVQGWQRASSWTFAQQCLSAGLSLLIALQTARLLGPTEQGYLAVWLSLAWFGATLAGAGLGNASVLLLAQERFATPLVIWGSSLGVLLLGMLAGGCSSGLAGFLIHLPDQPELARLGWGVVGLLVPGLALQVHLAHLLSGLRQFTPYNLVMMLSPLVTCLTLLLLQMLQQFSLSTVLLAYGMGLLTSVWAAFWALRAMVERSEASWVAQALQGGFPRALMTLAWQAHLATVLMYAVYRVDTLLLQWFWPGEGIGHFHLATTIAERVWMVSQAVAVILLPQLARAHVHQEVPLFVLQTAYKVGLWSLLPVAGLAGTCSFWLPWLFGEAYRPAIVLLWLLLPGIWLFGMGRILANAMAAQGRLDINMALSGLLLLVVLCGNGWATKAYGVVGAAVATSCAYALDLLLRLLLYRKLWQLDWACLFWPFQQSSSES